MNAAPKKPKAPNSAAGTIGSAKVNAQAISQPKNGPRPRGTSVYMPPDESARTPDTVRVPVTPSPRKRTRRPPVFVADGRARARQSRAPEGAHLKVRERGAQGPTQPWCPQPRQPIASSGDPKPERP